MTQQVIVNKKTNSQYTLLAKVGEGAYADVYKGENLATKEIVAIKKMKSMKAAVLMMLYRIRPWPKRKLNL
jgi:serine/threonine protein kinase